MRSSMTVSRRVPRGHRCRPNSTRKIIEIRALRRRGDQRRDAKRRTELTHPTASQFLVAPGHELPEIEEVVFVGDGYQIVRKEGAAAVIAEGRDPRS